MTTKVEEKKVYTAGEALLFGPVAVTMFAGVMLLVFPLQLFSAWCDKLIWNWFAAPYFHLPIMTLWVSFGIGMWVRLQTSSTKIVKGEETLIWKGILGSILMHSAALLVAYLIHSHIN